jgi:hypothetical protein
MMDLMGWAALTSTMLNCREFGCLFGARLEKSKIGHCPRTKKSPTLQDGSGISFTRRRMPQNDANFGFGRLA